MADLQAHVSDLESVVVNLMTKVTEMEGTQRLLQNSTSNYIDTSITDLDSGDTAWMLTSTALVLMMTVPGLALYYGGMIRDKNVVASVMQTFSITCLVTFLWLAFGYSLAFAPALPQDGHTGPYGSSPVIGDASRFWLRGLRIDTYSQLAPTIPESVYCTFQLTFAIITAALITGSFADRMKFGPMLVFITLWHLIVYCPIAHSVWHPEGFLYREGVLDFAGGTVVHICSGVSGLVSAVVLGHRKGFGKERFEPHNVLLTMVGSSLLWVGWFGFNAGSAVTSSTRAGYAMLATQIASAVGALSWMFTEWIHKGQPALTGLVSGAVAGLVVITPGSGYVDPNAAFFFGLFAGPVCYFGAQLKHSLGYDDALDGFGVHAIGGALGAFLTGFFATQAVGPSNGVFYADAHVGGTQLAKQIYGIVTTSGWAAFMTYVLLKIIDLLIGLRVSEAEEEAGLDSSLHGETVVKKTPSSSEQDKDYKEVRTVELVEANKDVEG